MEIRHLKQFLVLADELHFGRAAEKLGTAQPTLSQQILVLERDLGIKLFDRTKRRVLLTNAGSVFHREIQTILEQLDTVLSHARDAARGHRGILNIASSTVPLSSGLPLAIREFAKRYPDVELSVEVMHSRALIENLHKRRLHVAFARAGVRGERIRSEVIWEHQFRLVLPTGHAQSEREAVRLADLAGETLITFSRELGQGSYDELLAFCRREGFEPKAIREVDSLDAIVGLVACGLGITILPDNWPHGSNITSRRIAVTNDSHFAALGTAAYWNDDEVSPLLPLFLDAIRTASASASSRRQALAGTLTQILPTEARPKNSTAPRGRTR